MRRSRSLAARKLFEARIDQLSGFTKQFFRFAKAPSSLLAFQSIGLLQRHDTRITESVGGGKDRPAASGAYGLARKSTVRLCDPEAGGTAEDVGAHHGRP